MEVAAIVYRPPLLQGFATGGGGIDVQSRSSSKPTPSTFSCFFSKGNNNNNNNSLRGRMKAKLGCGLSSNSGFSDNGHLQYYQGGSTAEIRCGKKEKVGTTEEEKKKMAKKRLKLLKGLSRDLSHFSDLGFGLNLHPDHHHHAPLVDQVKGKMISEATELLLGQLQKLRAEEEELKRKRKEEKAKLKAARMLKRLECGLSSTSSSSSESSDSECGEVVDMSSLKSGALAARPAVDESRMLLPLVQEATSELANTQTQEPNMTELQSIVREANAALTTSPPSTVNRKGNMTEEGDRIIGFSVAGSYDDVRVRSVAGGGGKKLEVCMGGKCKKSGAAALLEEFQRVLGDEGGAVGGCKCMGKCKDGPNVRILNHSSDHAAQPQGEDDDSVSVRVSSPTVNPLCIGVGFEDVGMIVANFFGENHKELGLAATP